MDEDRFYQEYRPWGRFLQFCENKQTTVKIIEVHPGEQLSLQKHQHRDELWIALDPGLVALVGDKTIFMKDVSVAVEPVFITRGTKHSIKNTQLVHNAKFLEVAFGDFDEADIERIKDVYGRK